MAIFGQDAFVEAGADQWLEDHTPDVGGAWVNLFPGSQTAYVETDTDNATGFSGSNPIYYVTGSPASAEYDVQAVMSWPSTLAQQAVCGRIDPATGDFYGAYYSSGDGGWSLYRVENISTFTLLDTAAFTPSTATPYTVKLEIRDATKKVYVNGVEVLSSADNVITAAGKAGLLLNGAGNGFFDDFLAQDPGGGGGGSRPRLVGGKLVNGGLLLRGLAG